MASERELFDLSGPLHLTCVDWKNVDHRRSVAASLVQGVYIQERDRVENRQGSHSLAPHWWKFFHFNLHSQLIDGDGASSSIFGAIYEFQPPQPQPQPQSPNNEIPPYIIAFRGTSKNGDSRSKDLQLDLHFILNGLHKTSRFQIAIQAVQNIARNNSAVWLAGHSLGSAMAMLAGKHMAKSGIFLESFLFNPPFVSAPIEKIKDKKVKHGIRIATSFITAGLATAAKVKHQKKNRSKEDPFVFLKEWVPFLFVNPCDHICAEYIGYFEHRKKMEEIGAAGIERLATQHSIAGLVMSVIGKESDEPLHLLPSANLTVNLSPSREFKRDHGIHQWWRSDLNLQSKIYQYR